MKGLSLPSKNIGGAIAPPSPPGSYAYINVGVGTGGAGGGYSSPNILGREAEPLHL